MEMYTYSDLIFVQNLASDMVDLLEMDNERSKKLFKVLEENNPFKTDEEYRKYTFEDLVNVMEEEIDDYENLDEDEFIEKYEVDIDEAKNMVMNNEIEDAKTTIGILLAKELI